MSGCAIIDNITNSPTPMLILIMPTEVGFEFNFFVSANVLGNYIIFPLFLGFFFSHVGWLMSRKHPKVIEYGKKIDMADLEADKWIMFQKK